MVNNLKTPPKGIDIPIQAFQNRQYTALKDVWCFGDDDYASYGRCYKNQVKDGNTTTYIPEVFVSSDDVTRIEYKEVFFDDTNKLQSFFVVGDTSKAVDSQLKVTIGQIFHVNLEQLNTISMPHRIDEEVRRQVWYTSKMTGGQGFEPFEIITGIDNVFSEFKGSRVTHGMYARDMHPLHCFRINYNVTYYPEEC